MHITWWEDCKKQKKRIRQTNNSYKMQKKKSAQNWDHRSYYFQQVLRSPEGAWADTHPQTWWMNTLSTPRSRRRGGKGENWKCETLESGNTWLWEKCCSLFAFQIYFSNYFCLLGATLLVVRHPVAGAAPSVLNRARSRDGPWRWSRGAAVSSGRLIAWRWVSSGCVSWIFSHDFQ